MNDNITTITDIKLLVKKFVEDREWHQWHTPKNVSMQIATEAAELMELFLWVDSKESFEEVAKHKEAVEHEVADVMIALMNFCIRTNIDLATAVQNKMIHNAQKYPIEKAKGNRLKYTQF